jgi:uncharacterized membrane protein (UPF0127 family)
MRRWRASPVLTLAWVLAVAGGACSGSEPAASPQPGGLPTGTLSVRTQTGEVTLQVEIAETAPARTAGLMNRTSLAAAAGMVFLFDGPTDGSFWMKDTRIPLSIAFWDPGGLILAILDMEPCRADPCPLYSPGVTYVGAVEVNQGFFQDHGIGTGDTVALQS